MSEDNDPEFMNFFMVVIGGLFAFTIIVIVAANMIGSSLDEVRSNDPMLRQAAAERVMAVGKVYIAGQPREDVAMEAKMDKAEMADVPKKSGAELYQTACFACHGTGAAGAPKLEDTAAWAARIAQGKETLVKNAINGKGAMPPRGGASLSDDEIASIVSYMVSKVQ